MGRYWNRTDTCAPRPSGSLLSRGTSKYKNRPEATRDTLVEDGWLRTGDIAKVDEDGWFYITDRIKELIKYKGEQIGFQGTCTLRLFWEGPSLPSTISSRRPWGNSLACNVTLEDATSD